MANSIPNDLDGAIEKAGKEVTMIRRRTVVHSKSASREEANEISRLFKEFLEKKHNMEAKVNDITAVGIIGTFHWYDSKPIFPDDYDELKKVGLPKQSNLLVLEIRNYESGQDNRAIMVMGSDEPELETVVAGISAFYKEQGYEARESWGGLKDTSRSSPDAKF